MQQLTMPEGSPARAAFIMDGDYMEPYIRAGEIVTVSFRLPGIGECGLFLRSGRTLVRQFCEDSFGNIYLLALNRARDELDESVPAGEELVCLGRIELDRIPPLLLR